MLYKDIHDVNDGFSRYDRSMQRIQYLVKIPLLRSLCGSKDTPKLDQFFRFKQDVVLMSMESKFGFHPHWETVESPGWLYPEAQSAADYSPRKS